MNKDLYLKIFITGILSIVVLSTFMKCQNKIEEIENFEGNKACDNKYNSVKDVEDFGKWVYQSNGYHKQSVFKVNDNKLYFPAYGSHKGAKFGPIHYAKPRYSKFAAFQFIYDVLT